MTKMMLMNKIYRMITLRGLLIGIVLHICSTATVAQVGATFLLTPVNFNPNAQVGVAYGPVTISIADAAGPNSAFVQNPPTTVQLNDAAPTVATIPAPPAGVQAGLPPGITLSLISPAYLSYALQLSGTPTQAGTFEFVAVFRDASWGCVCGQGQQGYAVLTITVSPPSNLTITGVPNPLSDGSYGSLYTPDVPAKFIATGGIGTYTYAIGAGSLPPGMSLDGNSGVLSGTPTQAGTFNFHMVATDNTGVGLYSVDSAFKLTIDSAQLTITANDATMTYGGRIPTLPYTAVSYDGFVPGDDAASSLSRWPTLSTDARSTSSVGKYNIYVGGAKANNYSITYEMGNLYVDSAQLTIRAGDARMTYGQVPTLSSTAVSYTGFVKGENVSSLSSGPTLSTDATSTSPVGQYSINVSAKANNYSITYQPGTLYVDPAPLTITANAASMTYGAVLPALTDTYTGFVNGEGPGNLSPQASVSTTASSTPSVGFYSITAGGAMSGNYAITYGLPATLTVGPAPLTITANNASMTYGGQMPSLGVSYTGFVNGDDVSKLSFPASATTVTSASAAGTYPITAGDAVDPNYTFTYAPGTLTIGPAALQVTADAATKVYSASDPSLQYKVSGLANGDNNSVFTGAPDRSPGENVGIYPITQGTLSAGGNYVMNFTGNDLTITKAPQQITWDQRLLFGCDNTTQFQLTATVSSGLPITYTTSSAAVATVAGDLLTLVQPGPVLITASQAGNSNYFAAADVTDSSVVEILSLVRQHWGDALFFDNSSDDYVQWQWYKNGNAIPGATNPYYSETPSLNGQYYVIATENTGATIQTCPLTITGGGAIPGGITVYPNPALGGATVTVTCAYLAAALQGARMQIIDMQGKVWQQITNVQPSMQVVMPTVGGIYIISLQLSNGQKATVNVLVNE